MDDTAIVKALSKYFRAIEAFEGSIASAQAASAVAAESAAADDAIRRHFKHRKGARRKGIEKEVAPVTPRPLQIDELTLSTHRDQITSMQKKLLLLLIGGPLA